MKRCLQCGEGVTDDFHRVTADDDGDVLRCPKCDPSIFSRSWTHSHRMN